MNDSDKIDHAVDQLARGGLVVIPTETVYGLAADISQAAAIKRIFAVKSRPIGHPLIVHIANCAHLDRWAFSISNDALLLAQKFWPGPLTLILKRRSTVAGIITGEQETVGLRVPNHPLTLELLRKFSLNHSGALAAPSANRFGRISPTTVQHAQSELGKQVDFYLDGGGCQVGIESTILDMSSEGPRILRPGRISAEAIAEVLGRLPEIGPDSKGNLRVSGNLRSHYAPQTPLVLVDPQNLESRIAQWLERSAAYSSVRVSVTKSVQAPGIEVVESSREKSGIEKTTIRIAVLSFAAIEIKGVFGIQVEADPQIYARNLYARLRQLDALGCAQIVVESPPRTAAWRGIWDRLKRAATFEDRC